MATTIQELRMRVGKAMLGLAAACGLALVFIRGCGEDEGLGRRYPVHGRVMYRSQPLEIGRITFHPIATAGPARDATGTIQDGYYTLSTIGDDDGAPPGNYRVTIAAYSAVPPKLQPSVPGGAARPFDVMSKAAMMRAARQAKSLIPAKYISPRRSPLTREVKTATNRLDFELED
jgi:hypothetical protein